MKSAHAAGYVCLLFAAVFIAGCSFPTPIPIDACGPETLATPDLVSPVWEVVATLDPSLVWSYSSSCPVDEYVVTIITPADARVLSVLER